MTNPDSSRVVAEYLDGRVDTVYVKEIQQHHNHYHGGGSSFLMNYLFFRAITGGYMGYHFGRPYHYTPDSRYYRNQGTYNRVRNTTGSSISNTMKRKPAKATRGFGSSNSSRNKTTRPSSGRSGYGRSSGSWDLPRHVRSKGHRLRRPRHSWGRCVAVRATRGACWPQPSAAAAAALPQAVGAAALPQAVGAVRPRRSRLLCAGTAAGSTQEKSWNRMTIG